MSRRVAPIVSLRSPPRAANPTPSSFTVPRTPGGRAAVEDPQRLADVGHAAGLAQGRMPPSGMSFFALPGIEREVLAAEDRSRLHARVAVDGKVGDVGVQGDVDARVRRPAAAARASRARGLRAPPGRRRSGPGRIGPAPGRRERRPRSGRPRGTGSPGSRCRRSTRRRPRIIRKSVPTRISLRSACRACVLIRAGSSGGRRRGCGRGPACGGPRARRRRIGGRWMGGRWRPGTWTGGRPGAGRWVGLAREAVRRAAGIAP